jgi:hypothetical protein
LSGKRKKKRRKARGGHSPHTDGAKAYDSGTPIGGLHFTIGTGPLFDPNIGQLTLENDVRLLKAGLLYADRVRLVSVGSSLTLRMLADAKSDPDRQLDFLERHFRENISRDDSEAAATMLEFIRLYRPLRRGRNLSKEQITLKLKYARELGAIWQRFQESWEGFARKAGIDEIQTARRSGLVDIDGFAAGGVERGVALLPEADELMSEEYYKEITAELFGMLSGAVSSGETHPMLDDKAGELVRLGVEAGAIAVSESGQGRGKHAGLASHLLRRLPLFDAASVDEILDIRRELDRPLVRFRGAVTEFSEGMRASGWDPDFAGDAEEILVREVAPAVQEIEDAVRDNRFLAELWPRMTRPQDWSAGAAIGIAAFNLASLPEIASLAVGGGVGFAAAARNVYLEHREGQREIEGKRLFFYREAGRHLSGEA